MPTGYRSLAEALLRSIRRHQHYKARAGIVALLMRKVARLEHSILSILTSSDIDVAVRFGNNLRLPHPTGVVIHGEVLIGEDCMVMQQVTLGQLAEGELPVIGSRVYIGSGAKVLGPIKVGDGAQIGANAVVLRDVPPGATAVGVPARIIWPAASTMANTFAGSSSVRD